MSEQQTSFASIGRFFTVAAAVIIVLAGIKAASVIVVPFLLALFIAIICQPVIFWFQAKGLPRFLATAMVFVVILVFFTGLAGLVVQSANEFTVKMPEYRDKMTEQFSWIVAQAAQFNISLDRDLLQSQLDPSRLMNLAVNMLSGVGGMMTNFVIILLIVVFMLAEAANVPKKIEIAFGKTSNTLEHIGTLLWSINKYLALKTVISLITGVLIGFGLWLMDIDHFLLWAVLAFLLNYVPNIGSILAAFPAVVMALIQYNFTMAGIVAALFLAVNLLMGNYVEPRVMGRGLGLSTLVVFLSLLFWGWLLGPVGMLLSVPLTMAVKIALGENPGTRWVAIMLAGDEITREGISREEAAGQSED